MEVVQDVPVRVLGAAEMERYKEPELGPVTVRACMCAHWLCCCPICCPLAAGCEGRSRPV